VSYIIPQTGDHVNKLTTTWVKNQCPVTTICC